MKKVIILLFLSSLVVGTAVAENLQLYEAGKKAFSVGLYSIALENFNQYLDEGSLEKKVDAIYLSGVSAYYLKKYPQSLTYLTSIETEFSSSSYVGRSFYWIGLNYYYLQKYDNSIIWFTKNISLKDKYIDVSWLYKALANIKLNKLDRAKIDFNSLIEEPDAQDKYKEEALYRISTLYLEENDINSAINRLNMLIFDFPESKYYNQALALLSDSYFILKEWSNAQRSYELLLDYYTDSEKIYKRLATVSWNLGETENSKKYLKYYDSHFDNDKDVLFMLGDILLKEKSFDEALSVYEKVVDLTTITELELEENRYRVGTLYYRLGKFNDAYSFFSLVDRKEAIYFTILSGLKSDKDVLSAIKKLNSSYFGDNYAYDSANRYINFLDSLGDLEKLEDFLAYISDLYPDNITYSITYGELLLESNRLDESLKYLSKGYSADSPYYSNLSYKIGWIYYSKGEYARAITYFKQLKETDEDYSKALYSQSIALYKIGDLTEGREGFLKLLDINTPYNEEVSFYLGLIEKANYRYQNALEYFTSSLKKESLYLDSINNIAWSYYHLEDYKNALDIYLKLDNNFNAANCYLFMEQLEESLELYLKVINDDDDDLKSSSYYKSIEILFSLDRDIEAFELVKKYLGDFPNSDLPGEVIITHSDNLLYGGNIQKAIESYDEILKMFSVGKEWLKARYRLAEAYYLQGKNLKSINLYIDSIKSKDIYTSDSIINIIDILSQISDPELTESVKLILDRDIKEKFRVVPIYIEYIRQGITRDNTLKDIEKLIIISRERGEINQLIYLKSLHYYTINNLEESELTLTPILNRPEVLKDVKIDAILLQAQILAAKELDREAIDLYLKLYVNFPEEIDRASLALYKGLILTRKILDSSMEDKILKILSSEYKDTIWGRRVLDEK